jgi:hypothetical protein
LLAAQKKIDKEELPLAGQNFLKWHASQHVLGEMRKVELFLSKQLRDTCCVMHGRAGSGVLTEV